MVSIIHSLQCLQPTKPWRWMQAFRCPTRSIGMIHSEADPEIICPHVKTWTWRSPMTPKTPRPGFGPASFTRGLVTLIRPLRDLQNCLDIDPGYTNCKQHQAQVYLMIGETEQAMALFTETIEANFHSQDGPFIPIAVSSGDRLLALYMANQWTRDRYAPVIDWIDALENPNSDHTARLRRFERWAKENEEDINIYVGFYWRSRPTTISLSQPPCLTAKSQKCGSPIGQNFAKPLRSNSLSETTMCWRTGARPVFQSSAGLWERMILNVIEANRP